MGHAEEAPILQPLRQNQAFFAGGERDPRFAARQLKRREAPQCAYMFRQMDAEPFAQFGHTKGDPSVRRCGISLASHIRGNQCNLNAKLLLVALTGLGEKFQQLKAAAQVRDGFEIGRAFNRALAGALPVRDSLIGKAALARVVSEQFWLRFDDVGESPLQGRSDGTVQLLSSVPKQTGISSVAHQRVLEHIFCVRRRAALKNQAGAGQPRERVGELWGGTVADRCQ